MHFSKRSGSIKAAQALFGYAFIGKMPPNSRFKLISKTLTFARSKK
jgi:hypothetical protein